MVKNYLVCAVRPTTQGWMTRDTAPDLYLKYQTMYDISRATFRKFLQEPFDEICWTDTVTDNEENCRENWRLIKELWHSEPCNILWAGADTMMLQNTNIFGRFKEFRMFNFTDPRSAKDHACYFNDDVRLYPHTMTDSVWQQGEQAWNDINCDDRNWGFDQLRHNLMFWSQAIVPEDRFHPALAYQAQNLRSLDRTAVAWHDGWNAWPLNKSHIIHFHASRHPDKVIQLMRDIAQQLGVECSTS
jgi:hypothetical protein